MTDYQTGVAPDVTGSDTDDVFTFALSFSQRRLWLIDQLDPGNPAYNIPAAVRFEGPLDIDALEQAVNDVVGHHESLRTNVLVLEGEPRQVVSDMRRIAVRRLAVDAGTLAAARRHIDEETLAPFDLARDPLLRVRVIRLAEADHVVHLTIHHIVSDGWSMGVLVKEISEAYAARSRGMDPALPPLAIQYGDYAEWQREWLAGDVLERLLAYWREKLAPPLALLNLPIDHARGALQTFRGASAPFALPARETGALAAFARSEGATLFMVLLAAFKSLLFRYTGQEDLIVGSPIANRGRRELEPLVGFFVNTLVLRTQLSGDTTFRALLREIRETTLEAYAHQDLPFEQLVEALQPDRSLSRTPLFQVLFALQNTPVVPAAAGGALVSPLELESTTAKFDLSVSLTETPDGLRGAAEFNTDLFERATIERFVGHYRTILDAVLAAPDTAIGRVPLLTDADRRSLRDWNRSDVDRPGPHTLHELIEQRASETPHRPAVRFQFETLSYDELNRRANQLAHYLSREGIGTEAVVGVSLERSIDLIVALLAVLKSGAAYLPLDPTYPAERLKGMVQDAGATRVVTWRALQPVLDLDPAMLVCVDELRPLLDLQPVANPAPLLDGDNAAYVIFTSGSTGRPKGAVNTHAAIVNRLRWMQEEYRVSPDDRFLQKTPFGFDVSVWEIFAPLVSGACLVVAKPDGHKDPAYLTELIDAEQVTIAHFVPSMLRAFLAAPRTSKCPSLVRVFCSGEALPADLQRGFFEAFDAELSNLYGPTEAAVEVTFWRCRRGDTSALVPIGRPVANTRIHIVDESFSLVPVGIAGELLIGGAALARGYVGQPALTAERFIPNPFDADGERLYRTGDRARWSPDGQVEFLGRLDFQIKIRGFRIEAGEIEARLGDDPNVAAALVIGREVRPDDVRLVAYLVASTGGSINIQELRSQLGARLPEYMVPAAFVVLPALPLLASGKVDRAALPEPTWTDGAERPEFAPRSPTEQMVHGIWRELLGIGPFGIEDNFFNLGGHSLLATQVVSRVAELFHVELPLRAIFEQPTVSALSAHVDQVRRESAGVLAPPISAVERTGPLRLSFAQQRLWFLTQLQSSSAAYNMPAALRIDGNLDVAVLERTLRALVQRHEVLRSRFVLQDRLPVTIIDPEAHFRLDFDNLQHFAADEQDGAVQARAEAEFDTPFDLSAGPLVRARLLTLAPEAQVLLLTTHHIVSDGWSTVLLITDLVRLYGAYLRDEPSPLPPLDVQYADFAEWQRGWLTGPVLEAQLAYWKRQLAGAPAVVQLPTDRPRPAVQRFEGATTTFALGSELAAAIATLSTRTGATTFMTMLAAFFVLLSRYTRQSDLVVGSPMAGRNRKELEPVVGFFLNTLVLRGDLGGDPTFRELVDRVRHVVLDAYAHQDVPFEQIVEALQPDRSTSVTPLFQIVFSGAMTQASTLDLPDVRVTPLPPAKVAAKFDLTVGFGEFAGDITGAFEYNTGLFNESTMRRMASHYRTLLAAAAATPDARVSTLSMLPDEERRGALSLGAAGGNRRAGTEQVQPVPDRVAAVAARCPSATAVCDGSTSLTYAELVGRADALASQLRGRGVVRESRVAVCVERSAGAVVALLAVLRAGAAYVPLDPAYPLDRVRFMLEDSGATVLLVSAATRGHAIAGEAPQTIDIDAFAASPSAAPLPATDDLESLAYVIYTSGSTGVPKGVEVSHRALANLVDWHTAAFQICAADRGSQVASLAFDAAVWETWPYLASGAELHVVDDLTVRSPSALLDLLVARQITVAFLPTPLAEQMLRGHWRGVSLRYLLTGGDRLHDWAPRDLPFTLVNNYGPTENAVVASSGVVPALPLDGTSGAPSIGQPIHGTRIYLLDERLELVPAGVPGEIAIAGHSLARGYQGRADMTAARFVPNPFGDEPGARLYLSGDLGRWRDDGSLEFLRRIDRQVKVRGYRIELGELESVLAQHPDVRLAAATVRGDGADGTLAAYVQAGAPVTTEALRSYLRERLPEYMIPSTLAVVDSMPLTGSGKIDVEALVSRAVDPERRPNAVPPRTAAERLVSQVWAEVLGVGAVGAHDNFFEVGGHSLKLIEVHGRLEQALGRALSVVDLFRYPTVSGLAAFLSADDATTGDSVLSAAEQRAVRQRAASRPRRPPVGIPGPEQRP